MGNFFTVYVLIFSVLELRYTSGLMPPDVFTQTIRMPDAVSDKVRSSRCVIDTIVFNSHTIHLSECLSYALFETELF